MIPYLVASLLALSTDIVVNEITDSVAIPKRFDPLFPAVLFLLILATATIDLRRRDAPKKGRKARAAGVPSPSGDPIVGRSRRRPDLSFPAAIGSFFLYLFLAAGTIDPIVIGLEVAVGKSKYGNNGNPAVGLSVVAIGILVGVLFVAFVRRYMFGTKGNLWVSSDGIVLRDVDGTLPVAWSDVSDFYTTSSFWGGTWLVASVPNDSPLIFRGRTSGRYDPRQGVIKICNLGASGMDRHAVDGALRHWRP